MKKVNIMRGEILDESALAATIDEMNKRFYDAGVARDRRVAFAFEKGKQGDEIALLFEGEQDLFFMGVVYGLKLQRKGGPHDPINS